MLGVCAMLTTALNCATTKGQALKLSCEYVPQRVRALPLQIKTHHWKFNLLLFITGLSDFSAGFISPMRLRSAASNVPVAEEAAIALAVKCGVALRLQDAA
jgi:hypothetical protein